MFFFRFCHICVQLFTHRRWVYSYAELLLWHHMFDENKRRFEMIMLTIRPNAPAAFSLPVRFILCCC